MLNLGQLCEALRSHLQARHLLDDRDALELMAHGEANVIFRLGGDRLVRVAVNTPNQRFQGNFSQLTQFEGSILRYLTGSGLGHKLLGEQLAPTPDFPYTYLITDYIPGVPMDYSRRHLQQCATTLARLHRLPRQSGYKSVHQLSPLVPQVSHPLTVFWQEARDYTQPYLDSPAADAEISDLLKTLLAQAETRLASESLLTEYPHACLVHSDHTYDNWVVNDQQAYLIDWEWAEIGSPAGDLGHFLSPITIRRRQGYQMPYKDQQFFLNTYYAALEDAALAQTIQVHFAVFGAFPALRSLCWLANYGLTTKRWYADTETDNVHNRAPVNSSTAARLERLQAGQRQLTQMGAEVMALLEAPLP
ncbi:MAG: phosphotransferase [Leptolyngbyaceae cyanobacterium]